VVGIVISLMSCGGATDGKLNTDTTTFQSQKPVTDTGAGMHTTDTNDTRTPTPNGAPPSSPESRKTTPGMGSRDSGRHKH
jgi:hypothetical protein